MTGCRFIANLSWDEAHLALAAGAPAILPIGAGSKQHGFHLPMAADAIQAEWFALELAKMCGGLIWPTVTYGHYPNFDLYPGSVSIMNDTFQSLVAEIIETMLEQTASCVFVLNSGISTITAVESAAARCSEPGKVVALHVYEGATFLRVRSSIMKQQAGCHADEIETSIMLVIKPSSVDLSRAAPSEAGRGLSPGRLSPDDVQSPNYSRSGSIGDPRLADVQSGRLLISAILEDMKAAVDAAPIRNGNCQQETSNDNHQLDP